ncbi:TPA: hypothetical protein I0H29_RS07475 [Enterococcus faecalis]|nr:hypothetical protein [Enterococcus faecalis]
MLYDNCFYKEDLNPNDCDFILKGTYTKRYVYVDGKKTDEVSGIKMDVQLVDAKLFYPTFSVFVPIKSFSFNAFDKVEFTNLRGKFATAYGKGNAVELQAEADSISVVSKTK